jgi:hypothetical protein
VIPPVLNATVMDHILLIHESACKTQNQCVQNFSQADRYLLLLLHKQQKDEEYHSLQCIRN